MPFSINKLKKFIVNIWKKGVFHVFIGSFLTKFIVFFGSIVFVRILSKQSYGLLSYLENIYSYIYLFAGLGLGNAIIRFIVLGKSIEEKYGYYKYILFKGTIVNIFLYLFAVLLFLVYPYPEEFEIAKELVVFLFLFLPFQFLIDVNSLTYRALFDNKRFAIIAMTTTCSLLCFRLIGASLFDIKGYIIATLIVYIILGAIFSKLTYDLYFLGEISYKLKKNEQSNVNGFSLQYMITNGIWVMFMLNDIFLIGHLTGDATMVADYKVAYVLPGMLSLISSAIGIFIGPYFTKNESNQQWVWINFKKLMLITLSILIPTVMILTIFAKPVIIFVYGNDYENVAFLMQLLLMATFINSGLRYTTANILASMGHININMRVSIAGLIFQVLINIYIIPNYGAIGAGLTNIIVYLFMSICLLVVFVKKYRITNN